MATWQSEAIQRYRDGKRLEALRIIRRGLEGSTLPRARQWLAENTTETDHAIHRVCNPQRYTVERSGVTYDVGPFLNCPEKYAAIMIDLDVTVVSDRPEWPHSVRCTIDRRGAVTIEGTWCINVRPGDRHEMTDDMREVVNLAIASRQADIDMVPAGTILRKRT